MILSDAAYLITTHKFGKPQICFKDYLDRHASNMESMRKQSSFPQHPLIPSSEFDLRKCEPMSQVQWSVHIGIRKRPHPFWILLPKLFGSQSIFLLRHVDLEKFLIMPEFLICLFEISKMISFSGLGRLSVSLNTTHSERWEIVICTHLRKFDCRIGMSSSRSSHVVQWPYKSIIPDFRSWFRYSKCAEPPEGTKSEGVNG